MVKKIPQFETIVKVRCVGHPVLREDRRTDGPRRSCQSHYSVVVNGGEIEFARANSFREQLTDGQWQNLKTLGTRQWLCPRCASFVLDQRIAVKRKWF